MSDIIREKMYTKSEAEIRTKLGGEGIRIQRHIIKKKSELCHFSLTFLFFFQSEVELVMFPHKMKTGFLS